MVIESRYFGFIMYNCCSGTLTSNLKKSIDSLNPKRKFNAIKNLWCGIGNLQIFLKIYRIYQKSPCKNGKKML